LEGANKPAASRAGTYIEIVNKDLKIGQIRSVLFDFDGTISVIREGWQDIMVPMMVEELMKTPEHEDEIALQDYVREYVYQLTGKDTIYQMIRLAEEVEKRGGKPLDPLDYKHEYHRRLWNRIEHRVADLKSGKIDPHEMVIEGAIELLEDFYYRGLDMYLASGTDHQYVVDEAKALGIDNYFGDRIYGALDNYWERSKALVIKGILETNNLRGDGLLCFGDGFVEIENCKEVGGLAIGVASDEVNRRGINEWKRERLIRAGADIIIPDYTDIAALTELLFT
jgi:phosphoglycolate phosphatase-like HAD superfamily hydrolase